MDRININTAEGRDALDQLISEHVAARMLALRRPDLEKIERLEREIAQLKLEPDRRDEYINSMTDWFHAAVDRAAAQFKPRLVTHIREVRERSRREFAREMARLDRLDNDGARREG